MDKIIKIEESNYYNNIGNWILFILAILFPILKLTGAIEWRWIWVLSPIWIFITDFVISYILQEFIRKILKEELSKHDK